MKKDVKLEEMSRKDSKPLVHVENEDLMPLPAPLDDPSKDKDWTPLKEQVLEKYECALDDTCAVNIPKPETKEEEEELIRERLRRLGYIE